MTIGCVGLYGELLVVADCLSDSIHLEGGMITVRCTDMLLPICIALQSRIDFDNLEIGPERQWATQQSCWWPVLALRSRAVPS